MTTTTWAAAQIRAAILADPTDRVCWLVYADAMEDAGDPRAELVRLMASREALGREGRKRLAHLRGTVSLMTEVGRARAEAIARTWADHREAGDVAMVEDLLRAECHPLLMTWGGGQVNERRVIVVQNKGGGNRWTWAGNDGQGGGGAYADRGEAILAAFASLSADSLARLRWIDLH